ncbi:hypothetical protein [Segatella copri]|uniref:hypothetical protein n=1 Tax=Segatella copri TaxID=165179 RepID=UPI00258EA37D|nr:hypothetical protein [Segatella copri]
MKQKKKCLFVSSLALSLIFMPQVTSLAIAEEIYTSESTTKLTKESTANAQQKKGVKKQVTKKSIGKKQATRKIATRQVTNKKLDGEINVNGRVFTVNAFDNMIMVYENDESKSPSSKNFEGKIEDIRCQNHYVYIISNVTEPDEQRFTFYNVYKYDLLTENSVALIEYANDVKFDDTKQVIHTSTITSMGLNGATYDKKDFNM